MGHARTPIDLGFCDQHVLSGSHACFIYTSDEERLPVLARFLEAGRRANERLLYVADGMSTEEMRQRLAAEGAALGDETTVSSAPDTYYPDGSFTPESMLAVLEAFYADALAAGYSGARGAGELNWFWRRIRGAEELFRYEALLTEVLQEHPHTAICQYDARLLDGATMMDVLRVHPYMIVGGQWVSNPSYEEPAVFLETLERRARA